MAKVAITEQYLTDIADAIRIKTGLSNTFYPADMAPAILTISGSGGITPTGTISITTNGTYNVTQYASASVEVPTGSTISNQNKSVTPTKVQQQITYDNGYTGLGVVTVNAIPSNYIIPTGNKEITENGTDIDVAEFATVSVDVSTGSTIHNQNKTVSPSTSQQTVTFDSGYTGLGTVTVNAMPTGTAGTPTASKGTVSNHSITITPSVTNTTGYITGSTKTGTAVTVSASELVSGNKAISANGTDIDVTNYATVSVAVGSDINNQNKTVTPTESQQSITADSGYSGLGTVTVNAISSTYIGSSINQLDSSDLTVSGATVTVPAGYYAEAASKSVSSMTLPTSAASSATSGYTSKATIGRSTAAQYINIPPGYNSTGAYYVISAVANGSATGPTNLSGSSATITTGTNTITLTKTGVSTTPTVSAGYVSSATASTATVALTASVTVNPTPTASGATVTIPAGYYSSQTTKSVTSGSATAPSSISGTAASVSTGTNTLTLTKTVSVTPTVSAGYVSAGTAGNSSVSLTASVTTKAAATITPTTTNQTIAAGTYLTGTQTIAGDADLVGSNILSTANIFGVQGTVDFIDVYIRSAAPTSSVGNDGDIYIQE